jgi:hypothetical protein
VHFWLLAGGLHASGLQTRHHTDEHWMLDLILPCLVGYLKERSK